MNEIFREFPFTIIGGVAALGAAVWFGWSWWAVLVFLFVGLFLGAIVDQSRKRR